MRYPRPVVILRPLRRSFGPKTQAKKNSTLFVHRKLEVIRPSAPHDVGTERRGHRGGLTCRAGPPPPGPSNQHHRKVLRR